jgi:glutamate N-acetyltransferase / amino-acid N-acetyltransferase
MTHVHAVVGRNIKNVAVNNNIFIVQGQYICRSNIVNEIREEITVPGFVANGAQVGIKTDDRKDLSLIFSLVPAKAVGVFTTNSFKAAPVLVDMERIKSGMAQAILTNSGNANAATGEDGYRDALAMSRAASDSLKIKDELVLVASTGIIGQRLPLHKITGGMKGLISGLRPAGIVDAEEAILTTDKYPKISFHKTIIGGKEITLCGIAKGAGMISPKMATMLAFFMTDANIEESALRIAFNQAVNRSFNAITVDGCMSTNDTAIILANGAAGNRQISSGKKDISLFKQILFSTMLELSQAIVRDGEGATKIIEVVIEGAGSRADARKAAYAVANSNLVKTAFFGCDPNWGRIISAIGSADISLSIAAVKIFFEDVLIYSHGVGMTGCEDRLADIMAESYIRLRIDIGSGKKCFSLLTSDLGYDYVKINAHYHT